MPIRWRLTVFNVLVIGTILAVLGVSGFFLVRGAMRSEVEDTVRDSALAAARTVGSGDALSKSDVERLTLDGVFVTVRDGEGRMLFRTVDLTPGGIARSPSGDERSKAENRPAARLNFLREVGVTCTLYL